MDKPLREMSGEELLLMRIFHEELRGAIFSELNRRAGEDSLLRQERGTELPDRAPAAKTRTRLAA
jgi:hypothetical protein